MSGLCLRSGQDYAERAGLHLRSSETDEQALSRVHLFGSVESCLSYAFLWRASPGVRIGKVGEFTGLDSSGTMLSTNEKKAQAACILQVLKERLSLDQRAILDAEFGGEKGERHAGIDRLIPLFAHLNASNTVVKLLLMREAIFGERFCPSQAMIARECGMNAKAVERLAAKIAPVVILLRRSAREALRPEFERRQWIESQQQAE